ncbi:MAG: SRPBCC family protein, partial [Nitrospirae bacterium]|nr:SRPBCC family protein [Nitrospirota bacterium]
MGEEFSISKSAVIDASTGSVWRVVADPLNAAIYLDSVINVRRVEGNLYLLREVVAPEREGNLTMSECLMEVIEYEEKKSLMFRVYLDSVRRKEFGFRLEPRGREKTKITCLVKRNFVSARNGEIGREINSIINKIARMAMKRPSTRRISKFE